MENDFEIEILDEQKEKSGGAQLPLNFQSVGVVENDDVKVYIRQDVYKALEKFSRADVKNERGTFLLGECSEELGKTHVVISAYIEAKYTDASAATLTFTHETWDYVHKEQEARYPKLRILGWQHTHPSYGIFLSSYDLFIHENFFNLPFQIAYVIDPVQNLRGFFQWKQGKIEKLNGFYIYDEVGKPIKIDQTQGKQEKAAAVGGMRSRAMTAALVLALLLGAAGLTSSLLMWNKLNRQQALLEQQTQRELAEPGQSAESGSNSVTSSILEELSSRLDGVIVVLDQQQKQLDEQQAAIEALQSAMPYLNGNSSEENGDEDEVVYYTVQPGDTLSSICADQHIDFVRNKALILELNEIDDENVIYVGQVLQFPKSLQH